MAGRKSRARIKAMADAEKNEMVTLTKGELSKLLSEAAKSAASEVATELLANAAKSDGGAKAAPDMDAFASMFDRMAMAIAEISDQGTARKRVAPEVLAQRARAHEKMVKLINTARDNGEEPEYRLVAKTYLSEQFIEPFMPGPDKRPIPTEIIWKGSPNQAMRPLNDVARRIYAAFIESVGTQEKLNGADNRPFAMTPGGVVVKGLPAAARREIPQDLLTDDLKLTNQKDPTAPFVHVLGTVASPARQNVVRRADQVL